MGNPNLVLGMLRGVGVAGLILAAAACSSNGTLTVSGDVGRKPTIEIPGGSAGALPIVQVLREGTGPVTTPDDVIVTEVDIKSWRNKKDALDTYDARRPTTVSLDGAHVSPLWAKALIGRHAGSRVLLVAPASQGFGPHGEPPPGVSAKDTLVEVFDIVGGYRPDSAVTGTLPEAPAARPAAWRPTHLDVDTLVAGHGARLRAGSTVVVQYVGTRWGTQRPFDSSYGHGGPDGFVLRDGTVPAGWLQGLLGQRVGSRVRLDVPAGMAATPDLPGLAPAPDAAASYVIDILGVG